METFTRAKALLEALAAFGFVVGFVAAVQRSLGSGIAEGFALGVIFVAIVWVFRRYVIPMLRMIEEVAIQFRPNHGTSLVDRMTRMEGRLEALMLDCPLFRQGECPLWNKHNVHGSIDHICTDACVIE